MTYMPAAQRHDDGTCIQRLHFDGPVNHGFVFEGHTSGQVYTSLISATEARQHQQLDELEMQDGIEFFKILLASNDDGSCVYRLPRCIRLTRLTISAWRYIQEYLGNRAVELRELVVQGSIEADIEPRAIVGTIRRNGSLLSITMERRPDFMTEELLDHRAAPITIFGPVELRLINAYCQRNEQMSKKRSIISFMESSSSSSNATNHFAEMILCVIPNYLYVVRDACRMAPLVIFQMLLSMDTSIGSSAE